MVPWSHPSPQPKWHRHRFTFTRFCRTHDCDRPTFRETDRPTDHATLADVAMRPTNMGCTLLIKCSSASLVLTASRPIGLSMGKAKIRPTIQNRHLSIDCTRNCHMWLHGDLLHCTKFTANPSLEGLGTNQWNITKFLMYLFVSFLETPLQVRPLVWFSNDAEFFFMHCVLFWGLTDIPPYLGSNFLKTSIVDVKRHF